MRDRILIIDDDANLCETVRKHLEPEGFMLNCVDHREKALACVTAGAYALIILDVGLPGIGGFEMLRCLRMRSQTPVLIVTYRGDDADRILGLELGADDYLSKPCNPLELVARVHAILRRAKHPSVQSTGNPTAVERISLGDLELDFGARVAHFSEEG